MKIITILAIALIAALCIGSMNMGGAAAAPDDPDDPNAPDAPGQPGGPNIPPITAPTTTTTSPAATPVVTPDRGRPDADGTGSIDDTVVDAANANRVLLDYAIDTIAVVSMGAENYYIVRYKNVVCGQGIEIFADDGTVVTDAAIVDGVLEAAAWRGAADAVAKIDPEEIDTLKALVGSPQVIEKTRISLITSCDSLDVLSDDIASSDVADYGVLSTFGERFLEVDGKMVEMVNGTSFFIDDLTKHQKMISDIAHDANNTKKSMYADWKGRNNAKNRVLGTLVLIAIIVIAATSLILMKSKDKELSIKKRAHKLFERKKDNIIDQLHSRDADERARSALMAGASAEVDESIIPHLIVLLDDTDDRVRANAAQSIRRIGQKNRNLVQFAKEPIKRHLDDPSDKVRDAMTQAYHVVWGETVDTVEMTETVSTVEAAVEAAEATKDTEDAESAAITTEAPEEEISKATLTDAQQRHLHELKHLVNQSISNLPIGCDLCIPHYLLSICTTVADMIGHAKGADSEMIDEMIDAGEMTCKYIADLIENSRFIDICISKNIGAFDDAGFVAGAREYSGQLDALVSDPTVFVDSLNLEEELWAVDSAITGKMGELMIIPISGLWKVSKSVFDDASDESGTKSAFMVLISLVILGRIREMMENPEIVRRLRL
ncbi:MAG TPA: HEAT repeat domain-containing protein [Methanosarcinales archaeon]|nr:HEAT repeat domain-containing protein [Methanosarcinales archaeon]